MLARFDGLGSVERYLERHGTPIRYGHLTRSWPLSAYQNVYATTPGSAEMPSAGRPFTAELITRLAARGVLIAPITLHAGVSSPERHEAPFPEQFSVPQQTARLVAATKTWGGRVIAVGTTVVRALETAAQGESEGWTGLVITPDRALKRGRRHDHGLARARGLAPPDARGDRRPRPTRALLRVSARARVLVARVRRQPPDPALNYTVTGAKKRTGTARGTINTGAVAASIAFWARALIVT